MKQIFILVSLVLFSCGSRKVTIQETKKDSLVQIETKTEIKEETNIAIKNDILIDEFTITPLDSLKDIVINGISYKNAILRYKKAKDNSLHIEKKIVSKNEHKKETIKTSVKSFKKEIDKKANYWGYLWLLLIPLFFILRKFALGYLSK